MQKLLHEVTEFKLPRLLDENLKDKGKAAVVKTSAIGAS